MVHFTIRVQRWLHVILYFLWQCKHRCINCLNVASHRKCQVTSDSMKYVFLFMSHRVNVHTFCLSICQSTCGFDRSCNQFIMSEQLWRMSTLFYHREIGVTTFYYFANTGFPSQDFSRLRLLKVYVPQISNLHNTLGWADRAILTPEKTRRLH
jgi:hypothetical protein